MPAITESHVQAQAKAVCSLEPGSYYISATDAGRFFLVAGPYPTHREALANVDRAKTITEFSTEGRSYFWFWGTTRMADDYTAPGVLNRHGAI
ncbi:hypothetical protein SAMN04488503_2253 [Humidesulfovibrio mexicanus]|uniref:Uncharacterized protein n=1 Tax=Humidesulfovibrio mexicanus TaxID=147047 RepID=A0A239AWJ6_9BACT|nr:hypothetical protein [Humidesulfovibrio mexicanus]SNR99702.1 hypothetical protein SAMN04488503_2253 [Humidesulfovibrio mexicanus]